MENEIDTIFIRKKAALVSLLVAILIMGLKLAAYFWTHSSAILSDATESVIHVIGAFIVFLFMKFALQKPDVEHPYGHGKAEYLSVGFEGAIIGIAGIGILWDVVSRIKSPVVVENHFVGLIFLGAVIVINLILAKYLGVIGKKHNSELLKANSKHTLTDVVTSVGVLLGVFFTWLLDNTWVDVGIATLVAISLILTSVKLIGKASASLLDKVSLDDLQIVVDVLNEEKVKEWKDVHGLRVHKVGDFIHVDFHLEIPPNWTIQKGHDITEQLERIILKRFDMLGSLMIHFDVAEEDAEQFEYTIKQATRLAIPH